MKSGETLGPYRIEKFLGGGGMGEVYLAVDAKLNRPVALKILRKEFFSDPGRQRRFIHEACAASALDHPNIVTIYDIAEHEGQNFIVMQYVAGESLGELIQDQRLELGKALDIAIQVAEGLSQAHRVGIVHRDLKPDNVIVSHEGRVKIVDFGLAKLTEVTEPGDEAPTVDKRGRLTGEGEIVGTGAYMSPEQAQGKEIDARSDIFAFGSVLYEMVTGERAFKGEGIASVLAAVMRDEQERVRELMPTLPAELEAVIDKTLHKDRGERFQTMDEVREALLEIKGRPTRKPAHSQIVRVGEFEVDLESGELSKQGRKIKLQGKPFEILAILLERPGRVVSREELFKRLWPSDTFVDFDNSVNAAMNKLRAALGDSAEAPCYVETIPRRGYRFIGSVQFAEGGASSAVVEPTYAPRREEARARSIGKYGTWVGMVLVIALAVVGVYLRPADLPRPPPRTRPLTSFEGGEYDPALSADGNHVAFLWDGGKPGTDPQLYVKLIDGTKTLQLTDGPGAVIQPAWSPDGRRIAFLRSINWSPQKEIFLISALGGEERRVGELTSDQNFRQRLSWWPDGESLAIVDGSPGSSESIFSLSLEMGVRRQLTFPPPGFHDSFPRFSPDGETMAFVRAQISSDWWRGDIYLVPSGGGEESRVTADQLVWAIDWTPDGRELVFSGFDAFGGTNLWRVSRDGGEAERLPFGQHANFVTIARSGNLLAYAPGSLQINLWRVGGPTTEQPGHPERLIVSTYLDVNPSFSPDGTRLAFMTTRTGEPEVWICDIEGDNCGPLTRGAQPAWSPDAARIAYAVEADKETAIGLIETAGGFPRRLAEGQGYLPTWSRDGRFVYFGSRRSGRWEIWKVAAEGGKPQQVTRNGGIAGHESEDGRFLYFARHAEPRENQIWRMPVEGGEETLVLDKEPDFGDWMLWRKNLVYLNPQGENGPALELLDLDTKQTRTLVSFPNRTAWGGRNVGFTISPDGRWVVYPNIDALASDIVLVEDFR